MSECQHMGIPVLCELDQFLILLVEKVSETLELQFLNISLTSVFCQGLADFDLLHHRHLLLQLRYLLVFLLDVSLHLQDESVHSDLLLLSDKVFKGYARLYLVQKLHCLHWALVVWTLDLRISEDVVSTFDGLDGHCEGLLHR